MEEPNLYVYKLTFWKKNPSSYIGFSVTSCNILILLVCPTVTYQYEHLLQLFFEYQKVYIFHMKSISYKYIDEKMKILTIRKACMVDLNILVVVSLNLTIGVVTYYNHKV